MSLLKPTPARPAVEDLLEELRSLARPGAVEGMARYGIRSAHVIGVSVPDLRAIGRRLGKDHELARALWTTSVHDARILATFVEDPARVTLGQATAWARDLDNWAVCDALCNNLLVHTSFRWEIAAGWARRKEEYVRRAAYSLMANLTVHDKRAGDDSFLALLPLIEEAAGDARKPVAKSANWALRQIGKRNLTLHGAALRCAEAIRGAAAGPLARWIASDALRELRSEAVRKRFHSKPPR